MKTQTKTKTKTSLVEPPPIKTPLKTCDRVNELFKETGVRVRCSSWHSVQSNIDHLKKHIVDNEAQIVATKRGIRRLEKLLPSKAVSSAPEVQSNGKSATAKPARKRK